MIPEIALFASAVRKHRWMEIYESIKATNSVSFEIVLAGPIEPDYTLPDNVRHILTTVKPSQCAEIAARNTQAPALVQFVDDLIYSEKAFDLMYEAHSKDTLNIMSTCHYCGPDGDFSAYQNIMGQPNSPDWPVLPVCGMYSKEIYHRLGGADKRFAAVMWELDMYMRFAEIGVKTEFVEATCYEPYELPRENTLGGRFWNHDRPLILEIWKSENGVIQRTSPVLSFSDEDILTVDQNR